MIAIVKGEKAWVWILSDPDLSRGRLGNEAWRCISREVHLRGKTRSAPSQGVKGIGGAPYGASAFTSPAARIAPSSSAGMGALIR